MDTSNNNDAGHLVSSRHSAAPCYTDITNLIYNNFVVNATLSSW